MFPVIPLSNLSHFKELWSSSLEFRDICRDLGLVPSEFGELVRVNLMRKREEIYSSHMRDELAKTSSIQVFTLSYSETLKIPYKDLWPL